jgi:hypothetical protein
VATRHQGWTPTSQRHQSTAQHFQFSAFDIDLDGSHVRQAGIIQAQHWHRPAFDCVDAWIGLA